MSGVKSSKNNTCILSTAYFPPVQYFSKLKLFENIIIENDENYIKQTYRNRCKIYSANGTLTLSIPVKKGPDLKTKIKDCEIDYSTDWQNTHYRAIKSAYGKSPFYEFYIDDLMFVFTDKHKYLYELNLQIIDIVLENLGMENKIRVNKDYINDPSFPDYREKIAPKSKWEDPCFKQKKYIQIFENKHGFKENLSILDLLFNEGPNSVMVLEESKKKPGQI